ncbi:hypothetical protein [Carboxylicivirga linearis]|nr:hypothetical protein [Carboxylicivirga linearis]
MKENISEKEIKRLIKRREEENEVFKKLLKRLDESSKKAKEKGKK